MQVLRHPVTVIDRVIVPEYRLATEQIPDPYQVPGRYFPGTHLLAGPEDIHGMVQLASEGLQISRRTLPEHPVQNRVIGIVTGADTQVPDGCALTNPVHYVCLDASKVRSIGPHIVKQDGQLINAHAF